MTQAGTVIRSFINEQEGATMVEYGIMVALIAAVAFVTVTLLGTTVNQLFTGAATQVGNL